MPLRVTRRLRYTPLAAAALLGIGLTAFTGCGPSDEENEAAIERGREVMAQMQEDIVEEKSGAVAEALREQAVGEMSRGAGDQFTMREPAKEGARIGVLRTATAQGMSEQDALTFWEEQIDAVRDNWAQSFGEMTGQSGDRLEMLWNEGNVRPMNGVEMPEAAWPADESGEAMSRRITVGLLIRYGFSEAFSTGQWEQYRDTNRDQFIAIVKDKTGASDERAADLWDKPRG